jgi:hypothetical protein
MRRPISLKWRDVSACKSSFTDLDAWHRFRHFLGLRLEIGGSDVQATVGHTNEGTQDEQEPKETGHRAAFLPRDFLLAKFSSLWLQEAIAKY